MKILLTFIFLFLFNLIFVNSVFAIYDPLSVSNNKFGIHITGASDFKDAANLVNSSGGDWGYVTFVIQQTERDTVTWQKVFDEARRLHLIPIVRIATRPQGDIWEKPSLGDIDGWVSFLNSLNWIIKNRYVVIANEPNHAKEWGGEINPEEYASYLSEFSGKLKTSSDNFFVIPAGFDASSNNSKTSMDEAAFLRRMLASNPNLFDKIDGWASHSYPNPDFSGSENGSGRGSVRTFIWEINLLKSLGVNKELPVFITETGWSQPPLGVDEIGKRLTFALNNVWKANRIVAVTPFLLSYYQSPFDVFSWKDKDGNFFKFYRDVQSLSKEKGKPVQINKAKLQNILVQPLHSTSSTFTGIVFVRNEGQSIWKKEELSISDANNSFYEINTWSFESLEPGATGYVVFKGLTPDASGLQAISISLRKEGEIISEPQSFQLITISAARMKLDALFATIWRFFKGL